MIIDNFTRLHEEMGEHALLTESQKEWVKTREVMLHIEAQKRPQRPKASWRRLAWKFSMVRRACYLWLLCNSHYSGLYLYLCFRHDARVPFMELQCVVVHKRRSFVYGVGLRVLRSALRRTHGCWFDVNHDATN